MSSTKRANKLTLKKSATSKKPYINACGGGGRSILKTALEKPTKLSDGDVINLVTEDEEGHRERTIATTTTTTNELEDFLKEYEGNFNHVYAPPITTIPPPPMRPPVIDPRHGQQQQQQQQQQLSQYPSVQILEHIIIPAPLPQANTQTQPPENGSFTSTNPRWGGMHQFPNNPAQQQQQPNLPLQLPVNNGGNNHFHAPLPRGEKDMQLLREFYENVSPPSSAAIDQEEAPPPPPPSHESPRWREPSTPQELAMLSMGCLEKMLTTFQARQRNSQLQTERLERELDASRVQDENLHREMKFIISYMEFLKNN
ncbi:uncharacterized protein LOC116182663 [Photinus pyralis]|uniref:uncharacterized protein LOC116160126 n=1 Tax=Photinus pyralis TaxID=7054 RepID=UPI0012672A94|nr:uncharacterized protein LOC116160126 [Photinus pyralis]XP_031333685.1 uncharacterized protein LOC116163733 [Photinus pyralis]XP_031356044.1 uncharacterized protein LOC116180277 [Photinus pyralis]XP_031358094.1 uncharacterized protein LOC116181808 [Photinus pyralis]XP_031359065.1 uncharacterized protein LOC116182663 [Photinus pyralis]